MVNRYYCLITGSNFVLLKLSQHKIELYAEKKLKQVCLIIMMFDGYAPAL